MQNTPKLHLSWKMTKKTVGFRGATTSSLVYCSLTSYFGQGKSRVHNFKPDENCWRGHPVSLRFFEDFHLKGLRTFQRVHFLLSSCCHIFVANVCKCLVCSLSQWVALRENMGKSRNARFLTKM